MRSASVVIVVKVYFWPHFSVNGSPQFNRKPSRAGVEEMDFIVAMLLLESLNLTLEAVFYTVYVLLIKYLYNGPKILDSEKGVF
jgi:hypothetical protein